MGPAFEDFRHFQIRGLLIPLCLGLESKSDPHFSALGCPLASFPVKGLALHFFEPWLPLERILLRRPKPPVGDQVHLAPLAQSTASGSVAADFADVSSHGFLPKAPLAGSRLTGTSSAAVLAQPMPLLVAYALISRRQNVSTCSLSHFLVFG